MEYNEGLGDTSIDDAFNFNDYTKEEKKKKRSSILKQSKYANNDLYDDQETVTGANRKSLRMKRVSFAETFQVKSFIPESSILPSEGHMYLNPLENAEELGLEPHYPSYSILDRSFFALDLENEIPASTSVRKDVHDFLEDDMEMTMEHERTDVTGLGASNYAMENVVSTSFQSWQTDAKKNSLPFNVDSLLEDSPFRSGSQQYKRNEGSLSPLSYEYVGMEKGAKDNLLLPPSNLMEYNENAKVPYLDNISSKSKLNINVLNKENIQLSPKFQNLKFIDSPPKWINVPENILNKLNLIDFPVPNSIPRDKSLKHFNEGKENIRSQRKGLRPLIDEKAIFVDASKSTSQKVKPIFKIPITAEVKSEEINKSSLKSRDLELPKAVDRYSGPSKKNFEETNNKTRFSICDMEMTCMIDKLLDDSSLWLSPPKSLEKENIPATFADDNINVSEKSNKTRFSTVNMDLTCLADSPVEDNSLEQPRQNPDIDKMFELCTDYTFPNSSSKTHEEQAIHNEEQRKSLNIISLNNATTEDTSAKAAQNVQFKKPFEKSRKDKPVDEVSVVRRQPTTPGVLYNIRSIRQSLKESGNNIVLFPELSQVMKKHKASLKHPYTEMKITSPVVTKGERSRSFSANMNEASFSCLSRDGSRPPSIESLVAQKKPKGTSSMQDESNVKSSQKSLATASINDQSSVIDDSLQLLPYSAIENSLLDATLGNLTIRSDRSDFVLKEPAEDCLPADKTNISLQAPIDIQKSELVLEDACVDKVNISTPINISQHASDDSMVQGEISSTSKCGLGSKLDIIDCVEKADSSTIAQINKTRIALNKDCSMGRSNDPSSQNSEEEEDLCIASLAARLQENVLAFPMLCVQKDETDNVSINNLPETEEFFKDNISQNNLTRVKVVCATPNKTVHFNNDESTNAQEDTNVDLVTDGQADITCEEKESLASTSKVFINSPTKNKTSGVNPTVNSSTKLKNTMPNDEQQEGTEDVHLENEGLKNNDAKSKNNEANKVGVLNDISEYISEPNLKNLREKLNKASAREGMKWKVHSLSEEGAVFVLKWKAYIFEYALRVEVETVNASECSVSFRPEGTHLNYPNKKYIQYDEQVNGYKFFNQVVKDTAFPFSIYSDSLIDKLSEYSAITKQLELLMLDILKCSITGTFDLEAFEVLDPLELKCRIDNEFYECVYDVTFPINIKNYPCEKIVPDVKHIYCKDITEEVRKALSEVEPGKDYLYRMIDAARDVKP